MTIGFRSGVLTGLRPQCALAISALALILSALVGCSNTARPTIGPVEFTSSSGVTAPAVTSLAVNGQIFLVATVTNDNEFLGVSWTVACGSSQPPSTGTIDTSCGAFVPQQTQSGPVPSYQSTGFVTTYSAPAEVPKGSTVTITAHVTSLPSVASSVTLTILPAQAGNSAMAPRPEIAIGGVQDAEMHRLEPKDDQNASGSQKEK